MQGPSSPQKRKGAPPAPKKSFLSAQHANADQPRPGVHPQRGADLPAHLNDALRNLLFDLLNQGLRLLGGAAEEAQALIEEVKKKIPQGVIEVRGQISPALGVHTGPGLVGICVLRG